MVSDDGPLLIKISFRAEAKIYKSYSTLDSVAENQQQVKSKKRKLECVVL